MPRGMKKVWVDITACISLIVVSVCVGSFGSLGFFLVS